MVCYSASRNDGDKIMDIEFNSIEYEDILDSRDVISLIE